MHISDGRKIKLESEGLNFFPLKVNTNAIHLRYRSAGEGPCHLSAASGEILPYFLPDNVWSSSWIERYAYSSSIFLICLTAIKL
jgi:hypothetical protein